VWNVALVCSAFTTVWFAGGRTTHDYNAIARFGPHQNNWHWKSNSHKMHAETEQ